MNYPHLTKEIAHEIGTLWRDSAIQVGHASYKWLKYYITELELLDSSDPLDLLILLIDPHWQETYFRGNELQLPDCAHFFMENLQRLSDADYVPTKVC